MTRQRDPAISRRIGALAALASLLALSPRMAVAHEDGGATELAVEPVTVAAGGSCRLAGSGLEPNDERILLLRGEGLIVELGTARTDAEGVISVEVVIPSHVPAGTYQLEAVGDETLSVTLGVTAATTDGASVGPPATDDAAQPRGRGPLEAGVIVGLAVLVAVAGLALVRWADSLHSRPAA